MLASPAVVALVPVRCVVDAVMVTLAADTVASVSVRVQAFGRLRSGWLVCTGYTHTMDPIVVVVPDASVLEIEVEAGPEADSDAEAVEWAEAA